MGKAIFLLNVITLSTLESWYTAMTKEADNNFRAQLKTEYVILIFHATGSLHTPVTMYGINYAGTQVTHGTSKTKELAPVQPTFLCFESPLRSFASQHNLFRTV